MDRPTPTPEEPSQIRVDVTYGLLVPPPQEAYLVPANEWNRIKESIRNIRPRESPWFTAMWAFFSFSVSFLAGLLALEQQTNVAFGLLVLFYTTTAATGVAGIFCFFGHRESRGRHRDDVAVPIRYMEEIEEHYQRVERRE